MRGFDYRNLCLLASTTIICLLVFEATLRLTYPLYSNYNTEMWRHAKELKVISDDPRIAHENKANAHARQYGVDISINSNGWRDREYQTNTEDYRIMVLGDSITLGWGVESDKTFPKVLEKLINENKNATVEVINAGVGNYNTEMEVYSFLKKGGQYNPDTIIMAYYTNDAEITHHRPGMLEYLLMKTYTYGFLWDRYLNLKMKLTPQSHYTVFYSSLYEPSFEGRVRAEKAVARLTEYCSKHDIELYIIVIPEMHGYEDYPFQQATEFVKTVGWKNNTTVIDLLPYFKDHNPRELWVSPEDPHPNAIGHAIIARGIYESMFKDREMFEKR
jgi:lysophospholipase L1-like esterase